jgi:HK97 family phage major capsid protein
VFAVFGDFSEAYEIVMREDMYMIDDPYTNASSFERDFHLMTRVGGNVIKSEALTTITAA